MPLMRQRPGPSLHSDRPIAVSRPRSAAVPGASANRYDNWFPILECATISSGAIHPDLKLFGFQLLATDEPAEGIAEQPSRDQRQQTQRR
jgi:hypothetical protein